VVHHEPDRQGVARASRQGKTVVCKEPLRDAKLSGLADAMLVVTEVCAGTDRSG
jgi:hypothetical protein